MWWCRRLKTLREMYSVASLMADYVYVCVFDDDDDVVVVVVKEVVEIVDVVALIDTEMVMFVVVNTVLVPLQSGHITISSRSCC